MFSCIKVRIQKLCKWKACSTFPSLEREGDHPPRRMVESGWWKVEPSMLERRNVDQCDWYIKSMEQHFLSYIPRMPKLRKGKLAKRSSFLERKGGPSAAQMVDS